jgi:hypothetical protein
MAHSNSVTDRDGIEFKGGSARASNGGLDYFSHFIEVDVSRHDFTEAVGNTDKRLVYISIVQAASVKKAAMPRPLEALLDYITFHYLVSPNCLTQ